MFLTERWKSLRNSGGLRALSTLVLLLGVVLYAAFQSYLLASTVRSPGFDYEQGCKSVRNTLVYKQSHHDVNRVLPSPEFRPADGGLFVALGRFYDDNAAWLRQLAHLHPHQSHPVFMALMFGTQALFDPSLTFFYYNIAQIWFLLGVVAILLVICNSTSNKRLPTLAAATILTLVICMNHRGSALQVNLAWGQTNLTVMFLSCISIFYYTKGYARLTGVFLVLAASDKLLPLLLFLAISPKHYWRVLQGMVFGISGATFLLFSHAGIVVLLDVLRFPFILWNGPYNMLTSKPMGWLAVPIDHSLINGFRLLSLQIQASGISGLIAFVFVPVLAVLRIRRSQSVSAGMIISTIAVFVMISIVCAKVSPEGFWLLTLIWSVDLLYRLSFISNPTLRCLSQISAIVVFAYPLALKLFYEHHLIFPVVGIALFLLVLVSIGYWNIATATALVLGALALIMLNLPWFMFCEWRIYQNIGVIAGASTRFSLIGFLLAGLGFHIWTRGNAFSSLTHPAPVGNDAAGVLKVAG
jgi:hypothetical protein